MLMNDAAWQRHANPWSVYTRIPIMPLLALAIWSRVWIGWYCLLPILALIVWIFINPRIFPVPESMDNWASKATLGERLWLARKRQPIPAHHAGWALGLSIFAGLSMIPMVWGLYSLEAWPAGLGTALVVAAKIWFVDRMVWLYEDMQTKTPAC